MTGRWLRGRAPLAAALLLLAAAAPLRAQGFVVLVGADTVAVERVERTPGSLRGELQLRSGQATVSIRYSAAPAANALLPSLTLETGRDGAPSSTASVTFRGDSARVVVGGAAAQAFAPGAGALPYLNLSTAILEQMVLRFRAIGGDRAEIPLLNLGGGQMLRAVVERVGADSVRIGLGAVDIRARVDAAGRVLGARVPSQGVEVRRVESTAGLLRAAVPPDYSAPAGAPYTAQEVRVAAPAGHSLAGTLTLPRSAAGRVPAVVLITGSGQQDRDESLAGVAGYRIFRQIADTLARRGIAVLRLDDRGYGASTGDAAKATSQELGDDVRAALVYLRGRAEIDPARVGLVGHSEGGIIAPMVVVQGAPVRAIVLMAGTSRPGREVLRYQLGRSVEQSTTLPPAARAAALARIPSMVDSLATTPWMRFFIDYDPTPTLRRVRVPVLILQGATDRQVTADQAPEIEAALRAGGNTAVTRRVFPDVNHLFLRDPSGYPEGYQRLPSKAVAPEVLGALADWLAGTL
jgi:dienelactone hydrolase